MENIKKDITFKIDDVIGNRWTIKALLGSGGFGKVYKAYDKNLRRYVALKFIKNQRIENENEGFQILMDITHKNVVKVFNIERYDENYIFMVYEFIEGETLTNLLGRKELDLSMINEIMKYLLEGLREIEKVAWHRDIKLDNIMISNEDPSSLKILDLGIARRKREKGEQEFTICGTPGYIPPEAFDKKGDESYDVFMAGTVYFILLTKRYPYGLINNYHNLDFAELESRAKEELLKINNKTPRLIREIVIKAIKLNKEERFLSIDDMYYSFMDMLQKLNLHKEAIFNSEPIVRDFFDEFEHKLNIRNIQIENCTKLQNGLQFDITSGYAKCKINLFYGKDGLKIVKLHAKDESIQKLQDEIEEVTNSIFQFIGVIKVPESKPIIEGEYSKIFEINEHMKVLVQKLHKNNVSITKLKDLPYGTKYNLKYEGKLDVPICVYYSDKKGISIVNELKGYEEIKLKIDKLLITKNDENNSDFDIPFNKWIGTDESGKGDYFGPLVGAGFYMERDMTDELLALGIKDSKDLSDKKINEIAENLHKKYPARITICELLPEKYNQLYQNFRNLNSMLAWCHARVIQDLAENYEVDGAIADQFGDESYILKQLSENPKMKDAKKLKLIQRPRAESNLAVATASIIARDRFLIRLREFSRKYNIQLPKGASTEVIQIAKSLVSKFGKDELKKLAKLHFKLTKEVLSST